MRQLEKSVLFDISVTNDMQIALAKLLRPEINGKREFNQALMDLVPLYAANFRRIIEADARINPNNELTLLWCENRGQDPHRVLLFIKTALEMLQAFNNIIDSSLNEEEKRALRQERDKRLEKFLITREGILQ